MIDPSIELNLGAVPFNGVKQPASIYDCTKLVEETGTTIILVSHSMEDMAHYCDNVVVMNNAKIYKSGTVDEIFSLGSELSNIGLDVPLVSKIADELIRRGIHLNGTLYTVEGVKNAIIEYARGIKK